MANLKNTNIDDTGHLTLPGAGDGAHEAGDIRYNGNFGRVEIYHDKDGATWTNMAIPFLTRQIVTVGYIHGGYASSVVWDETNKTYFATDTTVDLSGKQEKGHNYKDSMHNTNLCWTVGGAANGHCVSSNGITCYNHRTENNLTSGYTRTHLEYQQYWYYPARIRNSMDYRWRQ
jgi:hypothetical protein